MLCCLFCSGQVKGYKTYDVCISTTTHKGKVNHGKSYCTGWGTVREYKDGKKDTVGWSFGGQSFFGNEYENYQKLSERNKYIVDSLKEDGVTQYDNNYLSYEPIYMRVAKKTEQLWSIEGDSVKIYIYRFFRNSSGTGIQFIKEYYLK